MGKYRYRGHWNICTENSVIKANEQKYFYMFVRFYILFFSIVFYSLKSDNNVRYLNGVYKLIDDKIN